MNRHSYATVGRMTGVVQLKSVVSMRPERWPSGRRHQIAKTIHTLSSRRIIHEYPRKVWFVNSENLAKTGTYMAATFLKTTTVSGTVHR